MHNASKLESFLKEKNIAFEKLGVVTDNEINIDGNSWGSVSDMER